LFKKIEELNWLKKFRSRKVLLGEVIAESMQIKVIAVLQSFMSSKRL